MTSPGRHLGNVLKRVFATCISDHSNTSLRPKLRCLYDVLTSFFCVSFQNHLEINLDEKLNFNYLIKQKMAKRIRRITGIKNQAKYVLETVSLQYINHL